MSTEPNPASDTARAAAEQIHRNINTALFRHNIAFPPEEFIAEQLPVIQTAIDDSTAALRRELSELTAQLDAIFEGRRINGQSHVEALRALIADNGKLRREVEELRAERDKAVAFASKVERGEVRFAQQVDEQMQRIVALPLGKTIHEGISDAVARLPAKATSGKWTCTCDVAPSELCPVHMNLESTPFPAPYWLKERFIQLTKQVAELTRERDEAESTSKEAVMRMREQAESFSTALSKVKEELAYLRLQRDALLEMTWLDLPGEPHESTKRWKDEFAKGWVRKVDLDAALARAEAGEKDTARLDWLEQNGPRGYEKGSEWAERVNLSGSDLRAAIDAATGGTK